jgi:S-adenosylmethionine hydrolase
MNVVTLTTDFGWHDYYVGVIKGSILCHGIPVTFADITHEIENYNIVQASYVLKNSYDSFPKGTIHLISVNNFYKNKPRFLAVKHNGHYFIGPDNGIFSLMFEQEIKKIYELDYALQDEVLGVKEVFAQAVGHILQGREFHEIGNPIKSVLQRISLQPITGKDHIRGSVIHIDNYQNVIFNIHRRLFDRICQKRDFELYFKRYDPIITISKNYADVPVGEVLCLFNSAGFLELAVNMDKAATLFGLGVDEAIQIDFIIPPID